MRCQCCDKNLNDYEATRRHAITGDFLDLCNRCLAEVSEMVDIPTKTREDLANCGDIVEAVDTSDEWDYNNLYREDTKE